MHSEVITKAQFPAGSRNIMVYGVNPDYQVMHRFILDQGRWFIPADGDRLSPAIIVNQAFLDALGVRSLAAHPTVAMGSGVVATIIGSYQNTWPQDDPQAYALFSAQESWSRPAELTRTVPAMEFWVPDSMAGALRTLIRSDLMSYLPGTQADVYRLDTPVQDVVDSAIRWVIVGVTVVALVLGALGLVNIGLVSVRTRMREIGIRRSLGATSGRIFTSVLLESVAATTLAGVLGVAIAIITLRYVQLDTLMGEPVETQPDFPWLAAAAGLAVAVLVGALTGLIPAIVAVRIRVIDAIRT
jgi:putative ABC transport system permease protein